MKILVLNGPNLNLLGIREEDIYGNETLQDVEHKLKEIAELLKETFDLSKQDYWIRDMEARERVRKMLEMDIEAQSKLNEDYYQEVKTKAFSIHKRFHNSGKSWQEIRQEYKTLKNPPAIYIWPSNLTKKAIYECETLGIIR